jgi:hypothetical protein
MVAAGMHRSKPCAACGGDIVQFEPPASIQSVDRAALPTACRRCGQICVNGKPLRFSQALRQQVTGIAEEAASQGRSARQKLLSDPAIRVEKYFDHVYRTGFVHGFVRALAWSTHQTKEGRLKRLRRLWQGSLKISGPTEVEIRMRPEVFLEFQQLIDWDGPLRGEHAQGPSDVDRAG